MKLEKTLSSIARVQHLINVKRNDDDIKKAIAQIKEDISDDIEN